MRRLRDDVRRTVSRRADRIAALLLIALFGRVYVSLAHHMPHGAWDAWMIWNLRAKFVALAPGVFDMARLPSHYMHVDYPPLLPLVVGLGWKVTGVNLWWPAVVHGVVLLVLLWVLRKPLWALALVGAVGVEYAATQYADTPLALTFLLAVVAYEARREWLVGLALGAGLLTKNEGALMALAFVGLWALWERRIPARALLAMAPFALALVAFKLYAASGNDIISASGKLARALDGARYGIIAGRVSIMTVQFGTGALFVLAAALWLTSPWHRLTLPLVVIGATLVGYLAMYAITPRDLAWHVNFSWDRLLWQVFPALVYSVTRPPPTARE
jgi:hypothetical protein